MCLFVCGCVWGIWRNRGGGGEGQGVIGVLTCCKIHKYHKT